MAAVAAVAVGQLLEELAVLAAVVQATRTPRPLHKAMPELPIREAAVAAAPLGAISVVVADQELSSFVTHKYPRLVRSQQVRAKPPRRRYRLASPHRQLGLQVLTFHTSGARVA